MTLGTWHLFFIRGHNSIALELSKLNRDWNDEILYQESRRIVTAIYNNIIYNEWLPLIIG